MYVGPRLPVAILAAAGVSIVLGNPVWAWLAAAEGIVLLLILADVALAPHPTSLRPVREMPEVIRLGLKVPVVLRIHNPTARRLEVAVADASPPSLGRSPRRHRMVIEPGAWAELPAEMIPARRGRHWVGPLTIRTAGPFRLGGRQATLPMMKDIKVYPALRGRADVELRLERARLLQVGQRSAAFRGGGSDFDSLRDYRQDDEFRHINWMATARAPMPIANEYREERNQQVVLLMDVSRAMAAQVEGVSRFEHALDGAIAVAELACRVGDHVGLVAFGSRVVAQLEPRGDPAQPRRILELLFDLEPQLDAANYRRAFGRFLAHHRRRSLLLLFTDLSEESVLEPLVQALPVLLGRHLVTVAAVSDPTLEAMARARPASSEAAFEKGAASGFLAWRDRARRRLVRLGAGTVDSPPGALAGRLTDDYLRIKALGRL